MALHRVHVIGFCIGVRLMEHVRDVHVNDGTLAARIYSYEISKPHFEIFIYILTYFIHDMLCAFTTNYTFYQELLIF